MAIWREVNCCGSIPDTIFNNQNGIIGQKWTSAGGNGDIVLYLTEGWGHGWQRIGEAGIDATDVMWDFLKLQQRNSNTTHIKNERAVHIPENFRLYQNYPNPFNPATKIKYNLAKSNHVILKIYNLAGQELETLINEFQSTGEHEITWHANQLPSGLYFYRIQAGTLSQTRKLILQK
ncbi:T9SS type A sorting domain-containing protein [candidate division KSB1 bacterium]|nr:T9SS type A sorting domain-containing protein [candidate division KSB1 bacterium]